MHETQSSIRFYSRMKFFFFTWMELLRRRGPLLSALLHQIAGEFARIKTDEVVPPDGTGLRVTTVDPIKMVV